MSRGLSITARGLGKRFGDRSILANLDLHVPAGQFLAIVGRSGSGKSTLLRLLTGLDTPSAGTLTFDGDAVARPPADALRVMFQEPRLLPWARLAANVEVGLRPGQNKANALAALRDVALGDRAGQWPATLSGGQKQRVALARALVSHPRFLAFDEPLGALDALTRIEMQALIERVYREQGFTAVLITHDVREALTLADRVVMIEDGAIALDVAVPFARPRDRGGAETAQLAEQILSRLLRSERAAA